MLAHTFKNATIQGVEPSGAARAAAPAPMRERILHGAIEAHTTALRLYQPDLLVCSEVLEHVPDPDAVMKEIVSVVAPGGTLVFTVPAGQAHWSAIDDDADHLRRFEAAEFDALLRRNGLEVLRLYTWGGPVSWVYNGLLNRVGSARAARTSHFGLGRLLARIAFVALRIDDLFIGRSRFQLVASARKPAHSEGSRDIAR
jgi:SAM-dependent methyltransferase